MHLVVGTFTDASSVLSRPWPIGACPSHGRTPGWEPNAPLVLSWDASSTRAVRRLPMSPTGCGTSDNGELVSPEDDAL